MSKYNVEEIRKQIIGNDVLFDTPFGERHMLYVDYTASGRGVQLIEDKMQNILKSYANTHTEDDYSGKYLTHLLYQAEATIKEHVHAGPNGKIIITGSGATGALKRLQEILGIYIPPVTRERINPLTEQSDKTRKQLLEQINQKRPIVFIGPYEHHTNELMWREAFVDVVVIALDKEGMIDLKDLEKILTNPKFKKREKFASFSAGSNVTGIMSNVYDIARICHNHDTLVFFDFAAIAPYKKIDMNKDDTSYFDAVFFSPHKFLGGPGTCGVLVFNENIYRKDLPPTTAGGGTVRYVGFKDQDYFEDIETREKAGTPPILQSIKTALVLDLKEKIGIDTIEEIEETYKQYFINKLKEIKNVQLVGNIPPAKKIPIISFNIIHKDRILHPKFVAKLLNDLFGIQTRAGCMCAGPYGHLLLDIDYQTSLKYRKIILLGYEGIKPGWVRVNLHYTLNQEDIDYLINTIKYIAKYGYLFLEKYALNMKTAEWKYIGFSEKISNVSIDNTFQPKNINVKKLNNLRKSYLKQAEKIAGEFQQHTKKSYIRDNGDIEELKYFYYLHIT
jgi:selenocysteine lyase/cysteine desulfurase